MKNGRVTPQSGEVIAEPVNTESNNCKKSTRGLVCLFCDYGVVGDSGAT